jgi:signal peptidase II
MAKRKRIILILLTILSCVGCDQITKTIAQTHLPRTRSFSFADDTLRLDYAENKGAVLSFEHFLPEKWRGKTFTILVALFLGVVILCLLFISALRPFAVFGLSLAWGGIGSNLFDRITFGYVVDFLNVGWGSFRSGIFNVADIAITLGLWLFVLNLLWSLRRWGPGKPVESHE